MLPFKILSTKILSPSLIKGVADHINISEIDMIRVQPIQTHEKLKEIGHWLAKNLPVIFTSPNAAEIIIQVLKQEHIELSNRTIYSLSGKTCNLLKHYFPQHSITTANKAIELAEKILNDHVKEIIFYCADIRRDELPDALKNNNVQVHEVIVYQTIETPSKMDGHWDGILFFSPSAVRSFFSANDITEKTICFAIGETTATTIAQYTKNKIIQSNTPDPVNMIMDVTAFFKTRLEHGIKE